MLIVHDVPSDATFPYISDIKTRYMVKSTFLRLMRPSSVEESKRNEEKMRTSGGQPKAANDTQISLLLAIIQSRNKMIRGVQLSTKLKLFFSSELNLC